MALGDDLHKRGNLLGCLVVEEVCVLDERLDLALDVAPVPPLVVYDADLLEDPVVEVDPFLVEEEVGSDGVLDDIIVR